MKDEIVPTPPLNETEIDQLDDFLTSDSAPDEAMGVSMMDGFITALASGPNLMMPGTMLGWISMPPPSTNRSSGKRGQVLALHVIDSEGIAAVIGSPPVSATRH